MNLNDYQQAALRTAMERPRDEMIQYCALGLGGEGGEILEKVKKMFYHNHAFTSDFFRLELGDVLWYVAVMADAFGLSLEDVAQANITKLAKRYPEGFSEERSRNRVEYKCLKGHRVDLRRCEKCKQLKCEGPGDGS